MIPLEELEQAIKNGEVDDSFESKQIWFNKKKEAFYLGKFARALEMYKLSGDEGVDPIKVENAKQELTKAYPSWSSVFDELIKRYLSEKKMNVDALLTLEEAKIEMGKCYEEIVDFLREFLDLNEDYYHIIAVWIISTYFHKHFNTFPFLFFNAMKGSGKTRTLRIISYLQRNGTGDVLNNASESVIFRTAQETGLIFDEFEHIGSKEASIMREILNSAYKRGSKVKRMRKSHGKEGEKQVVEEFDVYTPIAMANIWGMNEVLGDRCLTLILERSTKKQVTLLLEDFNDNPKINDLKVRLTKISAVSAVTLSKKNYIRCWNEYVKSLYVTTSLTTLTTQTALTTYDMTLNELFNKIREIGIEARNLELFFPLIVISYFINNELAEKTIKIASKMIEAKKDDEITESRDVTFLDFVASLPEEYQLTFHPVKDISFHFKEFVGEFEDNDIWVNTKWVGRAFKRLNLLTDKRKVSKGIEVILNIPKAREKIKLFKNTQKEEVN